MSALEAAVGAVTGVIPYPARMATVDEKSSDDELYAWFIDAMAVEFGAAVEVRPSVIHVWSIVDGDRDSRPCELRISRAQLRSVAYASVNAFDDSRATCQRRLKTDPGASAEY